MVRWASPSHLVSHIRFDVAVCNLPRFEAGRVVHHGAEALRSLQRSDYDIPCRFPNRRELDETNVKRSSNIKTGKG